MKRSERMGTAQETVAIFERGTYRTDAGRSVDIAADLRRSVQATRVIRPTDWSGIVATAATLTERATAGRLEVTGETTLEASRRLIQTEGRARVLALNFASAKNPGGGFLGGSQAQEESLARSSGLYATLQAGREYYDANRACRSTLYTDYAIHSPDVPVFRDDKGRLLDRPYLVSFLTMPAVNVGALQAGSSDSDQVAEIMARRVGDVIALAVSEGYSDVILGAWGCGVFRNDPQMIARLFRDCLFGPRRWAWRLERIVFAVFDRSEEQSIFGAFEDAFAGVPHKENKT
jgi:uncharacterized protein (TIGR02452 family)